MHATANETLCHTRRLPGSPFCAQHGAEGRAALAAEVGVRHHQWFLVTVADEGDCIWRCDNCRSYAISLSAGADPVVDVPCFEARPTPAPAPHTFLEISTHGAPPEVSSEAMQAALEAPGALDPQCVSGQCHQPRATGHALCAAHYMAIQ